MVWHYLAEISNYISSDLLVSHAKRLCTHRHSLLKLIIGQKVNRLVFMYRFPALAQSPIHAVFM